MNHRDVVRAYAAEVNKDVVDVIVVVKGGDDVLLEPVMPDPDPDDLGAGVVDKFTNNTRREAAIDLMNRLINGLHTGIIEEGVLYRALKLMEDAGPESLAGALGFWRRDDHRPVEDNDARNASMHKEVTQLIATGMSNNKAYMQVAAKHGVGKTTVENAFKEIKKILERRPSN